MLHFTGTILLKILYSPESVLPFLLCFFLPCLGMCCCKTRTNTHGGVFQGTQTQFVITNSGRNKTAATHISITAVVIVSGQGGKHLLLFASYLPPLDRASPVLSPGPANTACSAGMSDSLDGAGMSLSSIIKPTDLRHRRRGG